MRKNIAEIVGKNLTGSVNSDEKIVFNKWIKTSDKNQAGYNQIEEYWNLKHIKEDSNHTNEALNHLRYRLHQPRINVAPLLYKWKVAASVLLVISLGLSLAMMLRVNRPMSTLLLKTEKGQKSSATLADGTRVWLNADTELRVKDFSGNKRRVLLTGEAQFDVAKNANKPFIVETESLNVEVKGTTFNVRAYESDEVVKTSLIEGVVLVFGKFGKNRKAYQLKPGQSITYFKGSKEFLLSNKGVRDDISWKDDILIFKSMPFGKLTQMLERTYDVQISYPIAAFNQIHYTGTLENMTINQVMEVLSLSIPMTYKIDKNIITINQ